MEILVFRELLGLLLFSFHSLTLLLKASLVSFLLWGDSGVSRFQIFGFCSRRKNKKYSYAHRYIFLWLKTERKQLKEGVGVKRDAMRLTIIQKFGHLY